MKGMSARRFLTVLFGCAFCLISGHEIITQGPMSKELTAALISVTNVVVTFYFLKRRPDEEGGKR